MLTREDILQELDQEAAVTRRVLERVPEDKLDWRPHEKSFSLGQLAMHVATIPGALTQVSTLEAFEVKPNGIPRPSASSRAELLGALDQSLEQARELLGSMDPHSLAAPWKMVNGEQVLLTIPRAAFLRRIMLNHWYHHRGQLTVYLRQTGALVPGVYGPSADEAPVLG
ncbi:MAG TPA: DinB family protein [Gemmatimonadaceae bacterium]|nr:DinB family protein [Gemmatimonadaceae bacterium]